MRVVGFTYDADTHCVSCTRKYIKENWFRMFPQHKELPEFKIEYANVDGIIDGHIGFEDSEGNDIHPIFSLDEAGDTPTTCGDCNALINDSWSGDTVDYVIEEMWKYVEMWKNGEGMTISEDALDEYREHLNGCIVDSYPDEQVIKIYDFVREQEKG